jgi:hypothetical protein
MALNTRAIPASVFVTLSAASHTASGTAPGTRTAITSERPSSGRSAPTQEQQMSTSTFTTGGLALRQEQLGRPVLARISRHISANLRGLLLALAAAHEFESVGTDAARREVLARLRDDLYG